MTMTLSGTTGIVLPTAAAPTFSVVKNGVNQSIAGGTWTKVSFQTKEWDTANCFDNVTNFRYTPNIAGYYQFSGNVWMAGQANQRVSVWKNGTTSKVGPATAAGGGYNYSNGVTCIVYMNGSTDYVELYAYQNSGSQSIDSSTVDTWFQGALIRSA